MMLTGHDKERLKDHGKQKKKKLNRFIINKVIKRGVDRFLIIVNGRYITFRDSREGAERLGNVCIGLLDEGLYKDSQALYVNRVHIICTLF